MAKIKKVARQLFDDVRRVFYATPGILKFKCGKRFIKNYRFHFDMSGNRKLGDHVATWSTLATNYRFANLPGVLKNILGTCGNAEGCRTSCYVRHSYYHPSVVLGHAKNTYGMRHLLDKVMNDLHYQLSHVRSDELLIRLNQSGEIETDDEFAMWCSLAKAFPKFKFYIYTKMYNIVEKFLLQGLVPSNFTVLYSVWGEHGMEEFNRVRHLPNAKAFEFDDGTGKNLFLAPNVYCPAYTVVGKTGKAKMNSSVHCSKCKLCFSGRVKVIACHDH